jgi:signal transduction histidine kinase
MSQPSPAAADEHTLAVLGRLTRGTLHEIANPLLALTGTTELLRLDVEPGSKLASRLDVVEQTGQEITQIVRALQAFVRAQAEPEARLGLAAAAETAVALVRRVVPLGDVEVSLRVQDEPDVVARPGAVATSLVELLLEAVAAAERESVVELLVRVDGGDAVVTAGAGELRLKAAA